MQEACRRIEGMTDAGMAALSRSSTALLCCYGCALTFIMQAGVRTAEKLARVRSRAGCLKHKSKYSLLHGLHTQAHKVIEVSVPACGLPH